MNIGIYRLDWERAWLGIFLIFTLFIVAYCYIPYSTIIIKENTDISYIIITQGIFISSLFLILNYIASNLNKSSQGFKIYIYVFWFFILITFITQLFIKYGNQYSIPKIMNIREIKNNLNVKYPKAKFELKYMNDNYLFYQITEYSNNDTLESVKVLKIDELFNTAKDTISN